MKRLILMVGISATLGSSGFSAERVAPDLTELQALVGKKGNHPPLVAFLDNHGFWEEDPGQGKLWSSPLGVLIQLDEDRVCVGLRPPSDANRGTVYGGALPKGLLAGESDATITKKLGEPLAANCVPGIFSELIYDDLVVHTSGGSLVRVWLVPPGGGEKSKFRAVTCTPLVQVAAALPKVAAQFKLEAAVLKLDPAARSVELSYKPRNYMVQPVNKAGLPSGKPRERAGPDADGLIAKVYFGSGRYMGAAAVPQNLRNQHWTSYINAYPVSKGKQHLHLVLSFGEKTDPKLKARVREVMESLVDDEARDRGTPAPPGE